MHVNSNRKKASNTKTDRQVHKKNKIKLQVLAQTIPITHMGSIITTKLSVLKIKQEFDIHFIPSKPN